MLAVIGIYKEVDNVKYLNIGVFIGGLIKEIDSNRNEIIYVYNKKITGSINNLLYDLDYEELEKDEINNNAERKKLYIMKLRKI